MEMRDTDPKHSDYEHKETFNFRVISKYLITSTAKSSTIQNRYWDGCPCVCQGHQPKRR